MRAFAPSGIHVDHDVDPHHRVRSLSAAENRDDVLVPAGDVTDRLRLLSSRPSSRRRAQHAAVVPRQLVDRAAAWLQVAAA
jgi:hypothetical protein